MSYKAHLDEVITKKNPYLLQDNSYKYFLPVYDFIFNEIAKMKFSIKENGNSVYYENRDKNEIVKCNYVCNVANYTRGNWNYILLINILNQVKNSGRSIDINLVKNTAKHISEDGEYKLFQEKIKRAEYDMFQYFEQLDLYKYLTAICKFDFDEMLNTMDEDMKKLYCASPVSRNYTLHNLDIKVCIQEFTILITRKIDRTEWIKLAICDNKLYQQRCYGSFITPRGIYKRDLAGISPIKK